MDKAYQGDKMQKVTLGYTKISDLRVVHVKIKGKVLLQKFKLVPLSKKDQKILKEKEVKV